MAARLLAAVDIGGTRIKLATLRGLELVEQDIFDVPTARTFSATLDAVGASINRLRRGEPIAGLALAFPGLVDSIAMRLLSTPKGKFEDGPGFDVVAWARQQWDCTVVLENDANMALFGEWRAGAGRGCDDLVQMTLGTGIGTSAIIDGRPLRGRHFQAGCLGGHLSAAWNGEPCICGNVGCPETLASTWALPRIIEHMGVPASSPLQRNPSYAAVFELASQGDPSALEIQQQSLRVWGTTATSLVHAYDPERIILSGGVLKSADIIVPALQSALGQNAWTPWGSVQVTVAEHPETAALLGGAARLMEMQ